MAYNQQTGEWEPDDDGEVDVAKRLTALTAQDSDYMRQGEAAGLRSAHKRGLLNSTMAVQSGQAARLQAALPIASQDASQANQRVMQGRGLQSADVQQVRGIASQEGMQRTGIEAEREFQGTDIGSRERMQTADLASRERMQGLDNETRQLMQGLDIESQQRIASMNVAANERGDAARVAVAFEASYASMLETIMNNPEIPAEARQTYIDHANRIRESNISLLERLYGIQLDWELAA